MARAFSLNREGRHRSAPIPPNNKKRTGFWMTDEMSELVDLRSKISEEANQVLEAHARHEGKDKSEIVRDVLHEWAVKEIHKATLISRLTRREGGTPAGHGKAGNNKE